ncbi:MAG: SDR family NAD(P)-dependent oxidoreductase [Gammaproteobacteria bacterium]|nr:SDR family NAD(P)-dependent oxidoreductase [Gammaproteobacteria bacterium]
MKTCLITGASRGLGLSLSRYFKSQGYYIIGVARSKDRLQQLADGNVIDDFFICDLSQSESIDEFIRQFENKYQTLNLLVHNAGIQNRYDILNETHFYGIFSKEISVNFLAPVKITAALIPNLLKAESKILIITSLLQLGPKVTAPGYCSSKAALANWVNNLRAQLRATNVSVTEVIPGLIKTNMTDNASKNGINPDVLAQEIGVNLNHDLIVLKSAKLGWMVSQLAPGFVKYKLLHSES